MRRNFKNGVIIKKRNKKEVTKSKFKQNEPANSKKKIITNSKFKKKKHKQMAAPETKTKEQIVNTVT